MRGACAEIVLGKGVNVFPPAYDLMYRCLKEKTLERCITTCDTKNIVLNDGTEVCRNPMRLI